VCWAREGSNWCRNHDPAEADRRRRAGAIRRPRFSKAKYVLPDVFEPAKHLNITEVMKRIANIVDLVEAGELEPKVGSICFDGLNILLQRLQKEREYVERRQFAWEHGSTFPAPRVASPAPEEGSPKEEETPATPTLPPRWMQARRPDDPGTTQ
jgi:hypothetical protein